MPTGKPEVLGSLDMKVRPQHTALLVVDMQNDLCSPEGKTATQGGRDLGHSRRIIPTLAQLVDAARCAGVLVVFVQGTTLPNRETSSGPWLEARSWASFTVEDICMDGSWGQRIIDELPSRAGDLFVKKYRYSAFTGTNLDMILRTKGCRTTVIAGVSTNACVEFTARDAFSNDYYVVLPEDSLGSWSEHLHEATLENAGRRYATVCKSQDLVDVWTATSPEEHITTRRPAPDATSLQSEH